LKNQIDRLCIAKREYSLEVLYYCPRCESVNEIPCPHDLRKLVCHDCGQLNDASQARLQLADAGNQETPADSQVPSK
jgi:hypothetical protein